MTGWAGVAHSLLVRGVRFPTCAPQQEWERGLPLLPLPGAPPMASFHGGVSADPGGERLAGAECGFAWRRAAAPQEAHGTRHSPPAKGALGGELNDPVCGSCHQRCSSGAKQANGQGEGLSGRGHGAGV
jgi:hypothetical protein